MYLYVFIYDTLYFREVHYQIINNAKFQAISNIGHAAQEASPVLTACAWNSMLPMKLRVASITAFQRFPCEAVKV